MCTTTIICYLLFPFTPFFLDLIRPLNETRPRQLIYMVEFFIDEDKYFYEIQIHSYATTLIGFIPLISIDTFYAASVQHACGMFAVLGHRLRRINRAMSKLKKKSDEHAYREIVSCAIQHDKILQYCDNLNDTYTDSFFYIMGCNMISLSFCGVLLILMWGRIYDTLRNGIFMFAQIFHLFYYSFQGQVLSDQSLMISDCVYDSGWYTASLRTRKIMTMVSMRSLKPFLLTAKVYVMSLPNFTMVIKTSMSYFTVLKSAR
ncbi:hypothetical protein TSAR_005147 [Trichomalopsis sarcophagae]|uniref:Odorant receptor n=1 Tax=Trichomalopsis sarcophagae TaxID=543379 RepID=A0A232FF08_9HYME|nr:hypothetical protein TSAR_005147 [Trichomalopsis sarcophagae]